MYVFIFILFLIQSANSVDPDQMPPSAASDLGLHCTLFAWVYTVHFFFQKRDAWLQRKWDT